MTKLKIINRQKNNGEKNNSRKLNARQKQLGIMNLPGITSDEMEAVIKTTGPTLAKTIRKIISPYRGKTRSKKHQNRR